MKQEGYKHTDVLMALHLPNYWYEHVSGNLSGLKHFDALWREVCLFLFKGTP